MDTQLFIKELENGIKDIKYYIPVMHYLRLTSSTENMYYKKSKCVPYLSGVMKSFPDNQINQKPC